jgi:glycosyltransferase involved in cell wall biosynthesis
MSKVMQFKVCFLAGTLARGGAEGQLIYMLRALTTAGIQTRVLCFTKGEALEKEILEMGISVTWVGKSKWRLVRLCQIILEMIREPAQVLQSAHFFTNLYVAIAASLVRIKGIGAIRNDVISEMQSSGVLGWAQLHLPLHLIANSERARLTAIEKGIRPQHIDVVMNVVDATPHKWERNGNSSRQVRILFAARLDEQKRPERFLHVIRKITQLRPDLNIKGTIAGDGPLRSELEKLADSLGLTCDHIEFLGEIADLKSAYQQSDLLVLTSDWEGTPNVLLEAMGNGVPVVATNVGGVPEIVSHGENGFLAEAGDVDSVASSVLSLIENPELRMRMGIFGRQSILERHSPGRLAKMLTDVYGRLT